MVHENLATIYIYTHTHTHTHTYIYIYKETFVRLFTHDKSETPTPRPITPKETKKEKKESHNFLNFPRL